jgi:uncharacterized membrane protein YkoI
MRALLSLVTLGLLWSFLATVRADEEKVALDKVPKAVLDAVKGRFPDAKISGASREKEGDKTVYEITIKNKGQNIDVTLTPEGKIVLLEKEIAAKDLPKAVKMALDAKYPKAKFKLIEEVVKVKDGSEKLEYYEAHLVTAQAEPVEVEVAPDGKILKVEKGKKPD